MKIRSGFVSNSSSSSFVLNKDKMSEQDIEEFRTMRNEKSNNFDNVGETYHYFFGIIDYSDEFCKWLERKQFNDIEWGSA